VVSSAGSDPVVAQAHASLAHAKKEQQSAAREVAAALHAEESARSVEIEARAQEIQLMQKLELERTGKAELHPEPEPEEARGAAALYDDATQRRISMTKEFTKRRETMSSSDGTEEEEGVNEEDPAATEPTPVTSVSVPDVPDVAEPALADERHDLERSLQRHAAAEQGGADSSGDGSAAQGEETAEQEDHQDEDSTKAVRNSKCNSSSSGRDAYEANDTGDADGEASGSTDALQNPMGGSGTNSSSSDDDDEDDAGGDDKVEGGGFAAPVAEPPAAVGVTDEDPFADLESAITGGGNTSPDSVSEQEEEEEAPAEADAFGDLEALLG